MKRTAPKSGDLRSYIEIYSNELQPDGYGGNIPVEVLYWPTYAEVKPLKSSNRLEANQEELKQVYRVTVRARPDKAIDNEMTVLYLGRRFVIQTLQPDLVDMEWVVFDIIGAG